MPGEFEGLLAFRRLRDLSPDRGLWVYELTFHRARLVIGSVSSSFYDDGW